MAYLKNLVIMRGLPGAGKSRYITERIRPEHPDVIVCSADHHFMQGREYRFNPAEIGQAHARCQVKALTAMREGKACVVIDNTACQAWESALYCELAETFGYFVIVIDLYDGGCDDATLAARNQHGVPEFKIREMRARYERG